MKTESSWLEVVLSIIVTAFIVGGVTYIGLMQL